MKKYKHRLLTLLSVLAIGAGAVSVASATNSLHADAEETSYSVSSVLTAADSASVASDTYKDKSYAVMTFRNGSSVSYKQDLAYKWFTDKGVNYFSAEIALSSTSFKTFTVKFESAENSKSKDGKMVNEIVFASNNGGVTVSANGGDQIAVDVSSSVKISFANDVNSASGEYDVLVNGAYVGCFENIGGYFAEYSATTITPITFSAILDDTNVDASFNVFLLNLNGQSFSVNSDGKIVDDATPVLVVNQDIKSFNLGSAFSLSFECIDVLDTTVSRTMEYYQYEEGKSAEYKTLTTATYFFETGTSDKYNKEFVSIKFTLNDDDTSHSTVYDLSWYADKNDVNVFDGVGYIPVTIDTNGPSYTCVVNDTDKKESTLDENSEAYLSYIETVKEVSEGINAGSGNYFYLPSLEDLVEDDETTYSGLSFDIYYKTQSSSTSNSNTDKAYDDLEIEVSTAGIYSFRVVVSDASGNPMKVYYNGRWVAVTSSNVWDIDAVPEFTFTVYNRGVSIGKSENESIGFVNQSYSFTDFEITALSGYSSVYSLYYFDGAYSKLSYEELIEMANEEAGLDKYLTLTDGMHLRKIEVFDSSIDEDEDEAKWDKSDNAYYWYGSGDSFKPQEQGFYVLRVEVVDSELWGDKVVAYKIVEVESEQDVMPGETYWLRDNYITVIFAGIAVLALIGIVIILVIKPKDENIEDIEVTEIGGEAAVKSKKAKKSKKNEDID